MTTNAEGSEELGRDEMIGFAGTAILLSLAWIVTVPSLLSVGLPSGVAQSAVFGFWFALVIAPLLLGLAAYGIHVED